MDDDKTSANTSGSERPTTSPKPNPPPGAKAKASTSVKSKVEPVSTTAAAKKAPARPPTVRRPFPQNTLEEALVVPQAVKDKNNGKPLEPEQVAKACGNVSHTGPKFFYLSASSRDYGLTAGTRNSKVIALTDLGQGIVYPESAEQQREDKVKAFFSVKSFKDVFDHYGGGTLPEKEFVSSVLFKKFGLDKSLHDEFCDLYQQNCKQLLLTDARAPLDVVKREGRGGDEAVVMRQPGQYAREAFIVMPFSEKGREARPGGFFDEVLNSLIKPACNAADFGVETARAHGSDLIHHTIIRRLVEADLVVAELTDHNPNVLFELGIRIALDKPVLLIRAKGTPPIFDVDNMMRVCEYDYCLWKTTIVADITSMTDHVKGDWENRDKNPSYIGILKTGQTEGSAGAPTPARA